MELPQGQLESPQCIDQQSCHEFIATIFTGCGSGQPGLLQCQHNSSQGCGSGYFQTLPLPLPPLPLTKNEKTIVNNFFNLCESATCLLLQFIILRKQKPSFIVITLPTSLELVVPNYSVFLLFRYYNSC